MLSVDALTAPAYTRYVTAAHEWRDVWGSIVHGEAQPRDVDRDAWTHWRDKAIALLDRIMDAYEARWLEGATAAWLQRETSQLWTAAPRVQVREKCRDRERRHLHDTGADATASNRRSLDVADGGLVCLHSPETPQRAPTMAAAKAGHETARPPGSREVRWPQSDLS